MSKWYDENYSRGVTYYVIWLVILWVLSFQFPYEDYKLIGSILIVGGLFVCTSFSSYQHKKEYQKLSGIKEDIKSELYGEMYYELLDELKEELKKKK